MSRNVELWVFSFVLFLLLMAAIGSQEGSKIAKFIFDWQPLIAGSLAVLAAFLTISEMRKARQKTDEYWLAERARLKRIEEVQARSVIFKRFHPILETLDRSGRALDQMLNPSYFNTEAMSRLGLNATDVSVAAVDPEMISAFEILELSTVPIAKRAQIISTAASDVIDAYDTNLAKNSFADGYGNNQVDYSSNDWNEWRATISEFKESYQSFTKFLVDQLGNAAVPER